MTEIKCKSARCLFRGYTGTERCPSPCVKELTRQLKELTAKNKELESLLGARSKTILIPDITSSQLEDLEKNFHKRLLQYNEHIKKQDDEIKSLKAEVKRKDCANRLCAERINGLEARLQKYGCDSKNPCGKCDYYSELIHGCKLGYKSPCPTNSN